MSDRNKRRPPRVVQLDQTDNVEGTKPAAKAPVKSRAKPRKPQTASPKNKLTPLPDSAAQRIDSNNLTIQGVEDTLTPPLPTKKKRSNVWFKLLTGALIGLLSLALGLWVDQLVRDLFSRHEWLGWLAFALTTVLGMAAIVIVSRELIGLSHMATIERLRNAARIASQQDDMKAARKIIDQLIALYSGRPDTAAARAALSDHMDQIIDGRDLIALAERDLMKPLDNKAKEMVMASAKRVSVVTAISPRAIVDIGYVLVENMRLIRSIAELYGGRPGMLGSWRLARNVLGHLAITGSIAIGDGIIQQVVGHGLAAKISTRLGEGVVNGLLTARIGIAATDVCRPLEFNDLTRPTASDFLGELTRFSNKSPEGEKS